MREIAFTVDVEKDFGKESYANLKNLGRIGNTLRKKHIKTTFFVTSDCLEKYSGIFKKLKKEGHEIALHGYLHERWDVLSLREKQEKIDRAVSVYRRVFGENPQGFRAPQFSADFELIKLLNRKGFAYDSSLVQFPLSQVLFFPSRILLYLKQCLIRLRIRSNKLKIWEIMVSSFGLPVSAFTLRKLPKWLFLLINASAYLYRKKPWIVFLSHSYELDSDGMKRIMSFLERYNGSKFVTMSELAGFRR